MNNKYKISQKLLERAKKVTPVASQTYSKSYRYYCEGTSPSFIDRGDGCFVWDVDNNKFIDFVCALGPIIVGYNNEQINKAVIKQLKKGISFSQPTKQTIELAEKLAEIIPAAEMVRFVKNGSDATSSAIKLARAYTGRDIIAVSGYHGMDDWYIISTDNNKGIPQELSKFTKSFKYNNLDSIRSLFNKYPNEIAGVILEPIQGNGPHPGYLKQLKEIVHSEGSLLIFDEVVSGFRYALGGASELYNVTPDLVTLGKAMGNGLPISAVAGKKEIIKLIESENVFVSTTFGGEALSIVGALETIKILEQEGTYEKMNKLGNMLKEKLENLVEKFDLKEVVKIIGISPHIGVTFEGKGSLNYLDFQSVFQETMISNHILTVGMTNISLAHSKKDINQYLEAAREGFIKIKEAINNDSLKGILKGGKVNPVFKRNIT